MYKPTYVHICTHSTHTVLIWHNTECTHTYSVHYMYCTHQPSNYWTMTIEFNVQLLCNYTSMYVSYSWLYWPKTVQFQSFLELYTILIFCKLCIITFIIDAILTDCLWALNTLKCWIFVVKYFCYGLKQQVVLASFPGHSHLQYHTEGEGLGDLVTCGTVR